MFFRDERGALKISNFIAFWLRDLKKIPNFRRSQKDDSPRPPPPFNLWNQKNLANKEIFHLLFFHFLSAGKRKMCDSLPDHDFVDWYGKSAKQSMNWSCEYFCCSRYSNTVFHYKSCMVHLDFFLFKMSYDILTRLFPKILSSSVAQWLRLSTVETPVVSDSSLALDQGGSLEGSPWLHHFFILSEVYT